MLDQFDGMVMPRVDAAQLAVLMEEAASALV
jgi:hypothetical protein